MGFLPLLFPFLLGSALGSFANAVIARLPRGESIIFPASHCEECQAPLRWYDLVPIVSFLFLRGRCRYCGTSLSWLEPLVELVSGLIFVCAFQRFGFSWSAIVVGAFLLNLLVLSILDIQLKVIFDSILWFGLSLILLWPSLWHSPISHITGAALAGAIFWIIRVAGSHLFEREAMGFGDVQVAALLGFWIGYEKIAWLVAWSFVLGFLVAAPLLLMRKKQLADEIPFGPFLCAAAAYILMIY